MLGILTMMDVIEELIQKKVFDEKDMDVLMNTQHQEGK